MKHYILKIGNLSECEILNAHYHNNYIFSTVDFKDGGQKIPILQDAITVIEKSRLDFPYKVYADAFEEEYQTFNLPIESANISIFNNIPVSAPMPIPVYQWKAPTPDAERYEAFTNEVAEKYGIESARIFKTWERIILLCNDYENLLSPTEPAKDEKPEKEIPKKPSGLIGNPENPLIFDKELLINVHRVFNGKLWEIVDIDTLYNWFRKEPTGKIDLIEGRTLTGLCYLIGKLDKIKRRIGVSNIYDWMTYHIGGNNYSKNKNAWKDSLTNSKEKEEIDDLIKTL